MQSELPKVLVPVLGRPMIDYVLDVLHDAGVEQIFVVVGYRGELVRQALADRPNVTFVEQPEQLGTGHAVMCCREHLEGLEGAVLIVAGDSPMIQRDSVAAVFKEFNRRQAACLLGTAMKDDPTGLGRIVRDENQNFLGVVEQKDATEEQRKITEVNMSCYVFSPADLLYALERIDRRNAQGEYYITDCPGLLKSAGRAVVALPLLKPVESLSINTAAELAVVEQAMQAEQQHRTAVAAQA